LSLPPPHRYKTAAQSYNLGSGREPFHMRALPWLHSLLVCSSAAASALGISGGDWHLNACLFRVLFEHPSHLSCIPGGRPLYSLVLHSSIVIMF
jgi:hypothetical protein